MPDKKPTYEDIVAYCVSESLIGKVDTVKFYDYYDRQNFMFRGQIMDWKNKLHEWAKNQKARITQSAKEANAVAKISSSTGPKRVFQMNGGSTTNLQEYLDYIKTTMGIPA